MPRTQTNMMHNHRTMPYPPFSEVPSSRSYQSDYTPTGHERPSAAWTTEDDTQLMQLRTQGMNWGPISTNFPGKTSNACRKRHERLMEKKNAESWDDSTRIEHLSRAYLQVREQMWKILAETLGEKWQTVETKCMEKGLKTLTTAGRAARRHDLAKESTPPISGPDFNGSALCLSMGHSPTPSNNAVGAMISDQHLSAYRYPNTFQPQRQGSISSNGSIVSATTMNMAPQVIPMQYNNYSAGQPLYNITQTASTASPSYMTTAFTPNNFTAYAQPPNTPSMNPNYEPVPVTRNSPHTVPALPPPASLLAPGRSHREPITTSY